VCLGDKNGLDLISKCIRDGYEGEFLIISGYSEFEYARRAIEWDVSTYLLKPLDAHECREALEKVVGRLEKKTVVRNDNDIVDRIRSYIHKNYQHKLSLEEMASEYHMNRTYFSEFSRKNFGKTFVQYKTEVRIEHAKVLLKNSDDLVQDISEECGFENVTYFIQQFKEMTGDSPEQYRKRQR
jgi:YesN/AraC family two-component response regulator